MKIPRLFPVVLCAALFAQDKVAPNRFVPKDAQLVARIGAPAQWQQKFGGTKVARLLQGQALAPLVGKMTEAFEQGLEEAKKEGKIAPELLDGLVKSYAGDLVAAVHVDLEDLATAMAEERAPRFAMIWSMSPDGKYDLAALAEGVQKVAEDKGGELRDMTVGEHKLRCDASGDVQVTLPAMVDGHLVVLIGTDLEQSAAKLLAAEDRSDLDLQAGPLFVHLRADALIDGLMAGIEKQFQAEMQDAPFDPVQLLRDLGLGCLSSLDVSLAPDGEHVLMTLAIGTKADDHGLFGAFLIDQGPPKLLHCVPPACETFSSSPMDLGAIYRTVTRIWDGLGEMLPMSRNDAEAAFAEATKVRLKEDLLDHLGTELLVLVDVTSQFEELGAAVAAGDEPDFSAMLSGYCFGISLQNGKAFGESLETMLRARGLHAARKTEDYQGSKVHRLRLAAVLEVEYTVADDLLLLAFGSGESGRQNLRGVLDARASGSKALPEAVQKRLQGMPEGHNGVSVTPMASMLQSMARFAKKLGEREPMPEEAQMVFDALGAVAEDMKRLGIGDMVGVSFTSKTGMRAVTRW